MGTVSIIIPALNEAAGIAGTIRAAAQACPREIIVVDGGSADSTRATAAAAGARVMEAPKGRAAQMNAGAAGATGDILLFLHADTRLPVNAADDIARSLADPRLVGGWFDVTLEAPEPIFRIIETLMNARARITGIATGDQAIFVRRAAFDALGGFPEIPIMEDVRFSSRLSRLGPTARLRTRVRTSARRWRQGGVWRTILSMWRLRALHALGVSPERLARAYAPFR